MKIRARVYTKDGNRFLIPGHWYCDDDPEIGMGSASAVICDSMMWSVVCGLEAIDWLDLDAGNDGLGTIEHYQMEMRGPQFAQGAVPVMLIGGPLFDENHQEAIRKGELPDA
jgi:hypothetical protein